MVVPEPVLFVPWKIQGVSFCVLRASVVQLEGLGLSRPSWSAGLSAVTPGFATRGAAREGIVTGT